MKRLLTLLAILLFASPAVKNPSKIFSEAMSQGRAFGNLYTAVDNKKSFFESDIITYARDNDYIVPSNKIRTVTATRFGGLVSLVQQFSFIPKSEFKQLMYEMMWKSFRNKYPEDARGLNINKYSELNNSGIAVVNILNGKRSFRQFQNIAWSGSVSNGKLNGLGTGFYSDELYGKKNFCCIHGEFKDGMPKGKVRTIYFEDNRSFDDILSSDFACTTDEMVFGEPHGGIVSYCENNKYGFVNQTGHAITGAVYNSVSADFKDGIGTSDNYAIVEKANGEEWKINVFGKEIDYSDAQKLIFAKEEAERVRQERLAQQKAAAEKAIEEALIAAERAEWQKQHDIYMFQVKTNSNKALWHLGDRLCLIYSEETYEEPAKLVTATLEEWNENKSRAKVKIVTSPSSTATLNGDILEKNNTIWISTSGEGWHLALKDEIEKSAANDNSTKKVYVNSSSSSQSSRTPSICGRCGGRGREVCASCNGTGRYDSSSWGEDTQYEVCSSCNGSGYVRCYSCGGTGRQ